MRHTISLSPLPPSPKLKKALPFWGIKTQRELLYKLVHTTIFLVSISPCPSVLTLSSRRWRPRARKKCERQFKLKSESGITYTRTHSNKPSYMSRHNFFLTEEDYTHMCIILTFNFSSLSLIIITCVQVVRTSRKLCSLALHQILSGLMSDEDKAKVNACQINVSIYSLVYHRRARTKRKNIFFCLLIRKSCMHAFISKNH